jgi:hypothetical protein
MPAFAKDDAPDGFEGLMHGVDCSIERLASTSPPQPEPNENGHYAEHHSKWNPPESVHIHRGHHIGCIGGWM